MRTRGMATGTRGMTTRTRGKGVGTRAATGRARARTVRTRRMTIALPWMRSVLDSALTPLELEMDHTNFDPDYVFSHHAATPEKLAHYNAIHTGAKQFAQMILANVPECSDRLAVLRLLREASMLACAAVALEGRFK
jgi:hypothetical protein